MGEDEGLKTVDCLRGRLLAERHASKTANEDAQFMENKLVELENKLKEETKLRNKAEKKLKSLKKKLESLKILPDSEVSEQSSSSQNSADSTVSYASSSSTQNDPQESAPMFQNTVPEISENVEENASDTNTFIKSLEISTSVEKSDAKDSSYEKSSTKSDTTSSSSLKASTMEINNKMNDDVDDGAVDDSMALVPFKLTENKLALPEVKIVGKSVVEVLDSLRHARERIRSSMGRRRQQMIRVGPS